MLTSERLREILAAIGKLRFGILGDFALDLYYDYTEASSALSLETGKPVFYGRSVRATPGAAGNVVCNLAALQPASLQLFGLIGDDLYGRELRYQLQRQHVDVSALHVQPHEWVSQTYIKPLRELEEQNRLDFGEFNQVLPESEKVILDHLAAAMPELDLLILNQQFNAPLLTPTMIAGVNELLRSHPRLLAIADCRHAAERLQGVIYKLNVHEVARILGREVDESVQLHCREALMQVAARLGDASVLMTRGEYGMLAVHRGELIEVPGLFVLGETDTVGAGDTCIAAFSACLGAGATWDEAARIANYAAGVTVRKLNCTGTATPAEIIDCHRDGQFVYHPDIAADPRLATWHGESSIEVVNSCSAGAVRHVILDHDGTLSTLREGWESVMFQVAMECIAGSRASSVTLEHWSRIEAGVRRMIEQTTGIQTIQQMMYLEDIVRSEALVPDSERRDAAGYKQLYLDRLMEQVEIRIRQFQCGERDVADFTIKGAVNLLDLLRRLDLRLYLASGTDEDDVRREADILGYSHLFNGGIFGSRGNVIGDAKRQVIARILREAACAGDALMIIGDGPVEIREGKKVGALCIGVASDEVRRYGRDMQKRKRLIRAGADIVIGDFSQLHMLVQLLGLSTP